MMDLAAREDENKKSEIELLKDQIRSLQKRVKELSSRTSGIVDRERIRRLNTGRDLSIASNISYIVRAAVDGNVIIYQTRHGNKTMASSPKVVGELTKEQKECARLLSDKIIDEFEKVYSQKLWEVNFGQNNQN